MLSRADFLLRQPEFTPAPTDLLDAALNDAAARIDAAVFGASVNEAHRWLTADILATSPWGRDAQLVTVNKITGLPTATIYGQKYTELVNLVGAGYGTL